MDKAKVILASLLIFAATLGLDARDYSWGRFTMDGSRTAGVKLKGTAKREAAFLESLQPEMAHLKEVVGHAPRAMANYRPQSPLSNWLADVMLEEGEIITGEHCDVSLTNFGGIRVDMPQGDVTVDDIRSMLPFTNYVALLRMRGDSLRTLFEEMAHKGFQVLGGVKIRAGKDTLESVMIGGEPLDDSKVYTMISNSFLLNGGDGIYLERRALECRVLEQDFYEMAVSALRRRMARGIEVEGSVDDRVILTHLQKERTKQPSTAPGRRRGPYPVKLDVKPAHKLTILHTNDIHSHLEAVRSGRDAGLGGFVEIGAFVDSVRKADGRRNVLLLDAGDFEQGTSYFSIFKGKAEIRSMDILKYDVVTVGNHEWDNGVDALADRLAKARFKTVLCNYKVDNDKFNRVVKPYTIVRRGGMKIGIIGALVDVKAVVARETADLLDYIQPDGPVNELAEFLKKKKHCDLVIVLSHLGFSSYISDEMSDTSMAPLLKNVDIIIGGHSHTDLREPKWVDGADGKPVMVVTDKCWGVYVGEIQL